LRRTHRDEGPMTEPLIVYVEDCSRDAELFNRAIFQLMPHLQVIRFENAAGAMGFLAAHGPTRAIAVIVVDVKLPDIQGDELISWISTRPEFAETPIIAVSSAPAFRTVEAAESIGASSFILKPASYDGWIDLAFTLQKYCGS
jgi:two-component system, chemotaxis family, response regulator Rcp1